MMRENLWNIANFGVCKHNFLRKEGQTLESHYFWSGHGNCDQVTQEMNVSTPNATNYLQIEIQVSREISLRSQLNENQQ